MIKDLQTLKDRLVREVDRNVAETAGYLGFDTLSPAVRSALRTIPRHEFVPSHLQDAVYENRPLPIGHGQTISQPYVVAVMTEMLRLTPDAVVLEVGSGCGYQTAVLATLSKMVYSVEIVAELSDTARERLRALGYKNVHLMHGDGHAGWPAAAPYDAIIVTAAAARIPPPLTDQLKPGGRMVIPVGPRNMTQSLVFVEKNTAGEVFELNRLPVAFVPLVRA